MTVLLIALLAVSLAGLMALNLVREAAQEREIAEEYEVAKAVADAYHERVNRVLK